MSSEDNIQKIISNVVNKVVEELGGRINSLEKKLMKIEGRVSTLESLVSSTEAVIEEAVTRASGETVQAIGKAISPQIEELKAKVKELEEKLKEGSSTVSVQGGKIDLEELKKALARGSASGFTDLDIALLFRAIISLLGGE